VEVVRRIKEGGKKSGGEGGWRIGVLCSIRHPSRS
jgi:hypothetical protein